jgi:hypothetical protein
MRETVSVKDFGAVGDGVTDDTAAIQTAVDAVGTAGGGDVYLPPGTYLLSNGNPGAASWDNKRAIWLRHDNVGIVGAGRSTKLKLANSAGAHLVKIGQRAGGSVVAKGCSVRNLAIDGNRANQVIPNDTDNHNGGIDVSSGCSETTLSNLYIHDTMYYGIGFQRDNFYNCVIEDIEIENTGGDGIDCKDDFDTGTGNVLRRVSVRNHGLISGLSIGQAAVDLRSGWHAEDIDVAGMAGPVALNGIRLQNGAAGATPTQPTRVSKFRVAGINAANSVGVRVITRYSSISDGYVKACADGYSLSNPDIRFTNLIAELNTVGFRLWQDSAAGVESDTACMMGLVARSNSQAGIVYDSVDEVTVLGADVRGNGIGHDIRLGSANIKILGGSCTGNTTNFNDSGTNSFIQFVSGFRTKNVVSTSVAIDSTGLKSFSIPHNLPFQPNNLDFTVTLRRNTNVGDWSAGFLWITSADATNLNGQLRVLTASATSGAVVDVVATVESKNR